MADQKLFEDSMMRTYKELMEARINQKGHMNNDQNKLLVSVFSQQKDLVCDTTRTLLHHFTLDGTAVSSSPVQDVTAYHLTSQSPYSNARLVIKAKPNANADQPPVYWIEVWDSVGLIKVISTEGKHGTMYNDEWFGSVSWSPDSLFAAYVAEKNNPNKNNKNSLWQGTPQQQPKGTAKKEKESSVTLDCLGDGADAARKFDFVEDWGESYVGVSQPTLFILDVVNGTITEINTASNKEFSVAQVSFSPVVGKDNSYSLVFTGSYNAQSLTGTRLGQKYCANRESGIFLITDLTPSSFSTVTFKDCTIIGDSEDIAIFSPRFSPSGENVVYLSTANALTHNNQQKLKHYNISTKTYTTIVDKVEKLTSSLEFPGLFTHLPTRCFVSEHLLVCNTVWHSRNVAVAIDVTAKRVTRLDIILSPSTRPPYPSSSSMHPFSVNVLDVTSSGILCSLSQLTLLPTIVVGMVTNNNISAWVTFPSIQPTLATSNNNNNNKDNSGSARGSNATLSKLVSEISWDIQALGSFPEVYEYTILKNHKNDSSSPIILCPHGGPHSTYLNEFNQGWAFLASLGYTVLLVNYRGSLGFGKYLVDNLPGKCGEQDVLDTKSCLEHYLFEILKLPKSAFTGKDNSNSNKPDIFIFGGSHGGFLGCHLVSSPLVISTPQSPPSSVPFSFRACAVRNPVTNIASMLGVTDITDWCIVEAGTLSPPHSPATTSPTSFTQYGDTTDVLLGASNGLAQMLQCSPIVNVKNVTTPTLIMLGKQDRRVPPSQGLQFYNLLKKLNKAATKLMVYPKSGHAIAGTVEEEADHWLQTVAWFNQHSTSNN